ncbi:MAG TPA: hypothetical protein VFX14_21100 [Methylomirabilota bacterium]|nr:hypothetical protein [Methylomirabilota bacterium]
MKSLVLTLANLAGYAVTALALFALLPVADLSLPWWVALAAPAIVYTLVVTMCCPRANTAEAIGIVALLFLAHAALASATGMVYAALTELPYPTALALTAWQYLPAPVLQVLCVSLMVLPFRAFYAPPRARRRGRSGVSPAAALGVGSSGNPRHVAPELPPSPFATPELPPSSPALAGATPEGFGLPAPIAGGSRREGAERVEEVVSIPFARIADQLPAGAFTISPDRLGANMLEPGHLLVPTRLVIPQLVEGHVTVAWEDIADQFPRHALAVDEASVRDGLADGRIVLPLDEVVRRLPAEMFEMSSPSADIQGLERFPLPFRPFELDPDPMMSSPPPSTPAAAAPTPAEEPPVKGALPDPATVVEPEPAEAVVERSVPVAEAAPTIEAEYIPSFLVPDSEIEYGLRDRMSEALLPELPSAEVTAELGEVPNPVVKAERDELSSADLEAARSGVVAADLPAMTVAATPAVATPPVVERPPVVETPPALTPPPPLTTPPVVGRPSVVEKPRVVAPPVEGPSVEAPRVAEIPRVVPSPVEAPRVEQLVADTSRTAAPSIGDRARQGSQLAAVLTPFGALEVGSRGIEGVTLFTFASGALSAEAVLRTAGAILPFLITGRAPWTVDQLTVRREGGAIIVTPLGPVESGGPAMVASVGRVGSLALLEIVCLKAAREHRLTYSAVSPRAAASATSGGATYDTRNGGGLSLGFLAGDLDAFGRVSPTVLRDSTGGTEVCVFLTPGGDSRAVAGFSVDVCRALVESDEPALGALQSVTFRLGERRLVVRPVKGTLGRFSVLVAAGEAVDRPGLAHRQLERAAGLLRGV